MILNAYSRIWFMFSNILVNGEPQNSESCLKTKNVDLWRSGTGGAIFIHSSFLEVIGTEINNLSANGGGYCNLGKNKKIS